MRVVCMVPSWTETLLQAGVNVVGRTRFCIHPKDQVINIPVVGGTKDWNWERIVEINPDLILLDRDENPKFMSEQFAFKWHASHVQSVQDMPAELNDLSQVLSNTELKKLSVRWETVLALPRNPIQNLEQFPGLMEWGKKPKEAIKNILYLIWKDPWMTVSQDTFIGSLTDLFGIKLNQFSDKYPEINLSDYHPDDTLLLFSSEPFPFLKKKAELSSLLFPQAFVDGESYSWFGVRSLEFVEKHLKA